MENQTLTKFNLHFMLKQSYTTDSRGMKYEVRRLHPNPNHLSSRFLNSGLIKIVKYEETEVVVQAYGGNLNELQNEITTYLMHERNANVLNVIRKQVQLLGRSHTGSLTNYLNGVE